MSQTTKNPYKTLMLSKEFFEYWALEILKKYDFSKYKTLEFYGGNITPDLKTKDNSIGVEVTRAFIQKRVKLDSYCAEYMGARFDCKNFGKMDFILATTMEEVVCFLKVD